MWSDVLFKCVLYENFFLYFYKIKGHREQLLKLSLFLYRLFDDSLLYLMYILYNYIILGRAIIIYKDFFI